ncbi:hypothetical protein AC1031_002839 [Aphanomyces cochlioides]|nr:hypothetical protein AC1031_002839 [Aphanomyces cochlioides]
MLFRDLAATFRRIQMKNSRDASILELSNAFRAIRDRQPAHLPKAMYLVTSELAPTHKGVELRFRDKAFAPVVKSAFADSDVDQTLIFEAYKRTGDYGTAVEDLLKNATLNLNESAKSEPPMTIDVVYDYLHNMSMQTGKGSTQRKQDIAVALLRRCSTVDEAAFLARLLAHQNLRIGVGVKSIVTALAHAFADPETPKPSLQPWVASVAAAYSQRPIFEDLVDTLSHAKLDSIASLDEKAAYINANATPKPGTPIQTMLGYPASSLHEITQRMAKYKEAACEFKYDGARLQIHMECVKAWRDSRRGLSIFSRNMEAIPPEHKYFQLVEDFVLPFVAPRVDSFIIEGEVVAVDDASAALLPFQTLQTNDARSMCLFAFDCLYVNGTSLLHSPFRDRRRALHESFQDSERFQFVQGDDLDMTASTESLRALLQRAIEADCEGLMIKALDAPYVAGARTHTWLKLKRDYLPSTSASSTDSSGVFLPDTLDLVPIAAYRGKGRRANGFGSFLMACFDPETSTFQTVGKVGSGFSDGDIAALTASLQATQVHVKPLEYTTSGAKASEPDVWFAPTQVWEIRAAQLTRSAQYTAGASENGTFGLGLRFPRFVQVRRDKDVAQATSTDQLVELSSKTMNSTTQSTTQ